MSQESLIGEIVELLFELDVDPRHPLVRRLGELKSSGDDLVDNGRIVLTATIGAGGACSVTDQHGRIVEGVQSVASFRDPQTGRDVMQINL